MSYNSTSGNRNHQLPSSSSHGHRAAEKDSHHHQSGERDRKGRAQDNNHYHHHSPSKRSKINSSQDISTSIRHDGQDITSQSLKAELESYKRSLASSSILPDEIEQVLNREFVWGKKKEAEKVASKSGGGSGKSKSFRKREDDARIEETKAELEKLAAKRAERELEMKQRELERSLQFSAGGGDQFTSEDWQEKESEFYLDQARFKARVRIKEGRAHPIDFIAINLWIARDDELLNEFCTLGFYMDPQDPFGCLKHLSSNELESLEGDIIQFITFDLDPLNQKYWNAMLVVVKEEILRHRPGGHAGVSTQVIRDVDTMFEGKSVTELNSLQKQIQDKLSSGEPVDMEYWDFAQRTVDVWKAKAKLHEYHIKLLQKFNMKHADPANLVIVNAPSSNAYAAANEAIRGPFMKAFPLEYMSMKAQIESLATSSAAQLSNAAILEAKEASILAKSVGLYKPVRFMIPTRTEAEDPDAGDAPIHPILPTAPGATMNVIDQQDKKSRVEDDFRDEVPSVLPATYPWEGKYHPRKPKYINRVVSGYLWNAYNRTHYDSNNPPPKFIQGFKFNIFYPDLVDNSVTPSFKVTRDPAVPGTAIIRLFSGAPYQDIAFRIPDKTIDMNKRRGYRCTFDKGVLQVWFTFRRDR